jgi:HSP20 family protein
MATATGLMPKKTLRELKSLDPFRIFQQRVNRLFDEDFLPFALPSEENIALTTWTPSCDIYETENEFVVKAEIPGAKKEDVKVNIEGNILTLFGERKFEEEVKKENYVRVERNYGKFMRSFTLPVFIDTARITADFNDGLLKVTLPKLEEAKPKHVEVAIK